jgi:hypothetical protein
MDRIVRARQTPDDLTDAGPMNFRREKTDAELQ